MILGGETCQPPNNVTGGKDGFCYRDRYTLASLRLKNFWSDGFTSLGKKEEMSAAHSKGTCTMIRCRDRVTVVTVEGGETADGPYECDHEHIVIPLCPTVWLSPVSPRYSDKNLEKQKIRLGFCHINVRTR